MPPFARAAGWTAVLLIGCGGCLPAASSSNSTNAPADDYQSSHGVAAHRPASFAAAIAQLTDRQAAFLSDDPPTAAATAMQELQDIVRWLPELAGETDLRRADWEAVQRLANELQSVVDPWTAAHDVAAPQARAEYERILAALRPLAAKSAAPAPGT
jgi:hypothetical protein